MVARGARGLGRVGGCYTTDWWEGRREGGCYTTDWWEGGRVLHHRLVGGREGGRVGGEPGAWGARRVTGRWGRGWVAGKFITPNWRGKKKINNTKTLFNFV